VQRPSAWGGMTPNALELLLHVYNFSQSLGLALIISHPLRFPVRRGLSALIDGMGMWELYLFRNGGTVYILYAAGSDSTSLEP